MTLAHELVALVLVAVGVSTSYLAITRDWPWRWFRSDVDIEDASETAGTWTPYPPDVDRGDQYARERLARIATMQRREHL